METKICCQKKDTWFYPGAVAGVRRCELSMFSLCLTSFQHPTKIEISAPPTKSSILSFLGIICYWNCSCNNKRVMMTTQRCHTNKSITLYVHHTYSIVPHLHIFTTYDGIWIIVLWQVGGDGDQEVVVAMVPELKAPNLNSSTKRRPSDFEVTPSGFNFCTLFLD